MSKQKRMLCSTLHELMAFAHTGASRAHAAVNVSRTSWGAVFYSRLLMHSWKSSDLKTTDVTPPMQYDKVGVCVPVAPVSSAASLKAFVRLAASCPVMASMTNSVSDGLMAR